MKNLKEELFKHLKSNLLRKLEENTILEKMVEEIKELADRVKALEGKHE